MWETSEVFQFCKSTDQYSDKVISTQPVLAKPQGSANIKKGSGGLHVINTCPTPLQNLHRHLRFTDTEAAHIRLVSSAVNRKLWKW